MKIIINTCYGGYSLSDAAYERLIELGVPVRGYIEQKRDPKTGRYLPEPLNEGKVIFDRDLDSFENEKEQRLNEALRRLSGRYWESWSRDDCRVDPLVIQVVEELGEKANGRCAKLKVIEIPDGIEWEISEYDGIEHVAQKHEIWD